MKGNQLLMPPFHSHSDRSLFKLVFKDRVPPFPVKVHSTRSVSMSCLFRQLFPRSPSLPPSLLFTYHISFTRWMFRPHLFLTLTIRSFRQLFELQVAPCSIFFCYVGLFEFSLLLPPPPVGQLLDIPIVSE